MWRNGLFAVIGHEHEAAVLGCRSSTTVEARLTPLGLELILGIPPPNILHRPSSRYERLLSPIRKIHHFSLKLLIKVKALSTFMAPGDITTQIEEISRGKREPRQAVRVTLDRLGHEIFKHDCLDRRLKRHHVTGNCSLNFTMTTGLRRTGIAFSGAVGIGLFQTTGEIIALSGPVGALLAYFFAGLTIFAVMRSLAEMASVRPVSGAIMDFPDVFVDKALGFSVGLMYWYVD